MRTPHLLSVLLVTAALSGCASLTHTPYQPPAVTLPAQFEHSLATETIVPVADPAWWRAFGDPQLDAWIDLALARNPDLATAAIRVRRTTLEARLAGNALWPTPSANMGTGVGRPLSGIPRSTTENASGNLSVAWEIDLFDRLGAQRDAARFEAEATREDLDAVGLSMVGSTAGLYWQLAFVNERIASAQQSLTYVQRLRELVALQYQAGTVSRLEQREAEQSFAQQQVALSQLLQARTELRQALVVLFDGVTPTGTEPQQLPLVALPAVDAGLPARLLARRPDLRAAELRLRASLASSDAATARFYPSLSLTGALGTSSSELLRVLANPVATLGANMALPFLNVPEMRLTTAIARARHEEAVVGFRKTLYTALADVERVLSARTQLMLQEVSLRSARDEAGQIERLYETRYRAGQVPLRAWLDAQERLRAADLAHAATRMAVLQNRMAIYQALGDGLIADSSEMR